MGGVENNFLISISQKNEEELARFSLGSAVKLIKECFPLIPPPSTPLPASPTSNPSALTQTPPPPPKVRMASAVQLPIFKGVGNEEPSWFWFVIKFVWDTQGITDENIKKDTLDSALQDRALTWYIK